jgi:hypothetical protein
LGDFLVTLRGVNVMNSALVAWRLRIWNICRTIVFIILRVASFFYLRVLKPFRDGGLPEASKPENGYF